MPKGKYKPVTSQAQRGKLFALAAEGKLPMHEARGKARAAKGKDLPAYAPKKKR